MRADYALRVTLHVNSPQEEVESAHHTPQGLLNICCAYDHMGLSIMLLVTEEAADPVDLMPCF